MLFMGTPSVTLTLGARTDATAPVATRQLAAKDQAVAYHFEISTSSARSPESYSRFFLDGEFATASP